MCSSRLPAAQPRVRGRRRAAAARLVGSLILVAACGERTRAPTKHAVLPVDGRQERVEMRLYVPPPHFPLSFTTYLPPGVRPEPGPPGESASLSFVREGGGEGPTGAFVHLFVAPAGTGEQAARELVRAAAERFQVPGTDAELRPENAHPWAVEEYELRSRGTLRDRLGWMALGRREGRWFLLIVQVPVPLAESFGPRAEAILDEWRWKEGAEPRRLTD